MIRGPIGVVAKISCEKYCAQHIESMGMNTKTKTNCIFSERRDSISSQEISTDISVIPVTSYTQFNHKSNFKMNIISGIIPFIFLLSCTHATPITMMLFGNAGPQYFSSISPGKWTRVARSDESPLPSSGGGYESGDYGSSSQGGFEPSTGHGQDNQQDYSQFANFEHQNQESSHFSHDQDDFGGHDFHDNHVHSVPISEHVEVTKPVTVPVYKEIGVPVSYPVKIHIPHPVAVNVPQPYPVLVPVSHPVPIQIIKTVAVPVEKKIPYPVEKHIPYPIEKPVPITIERHIPVPVEKPYPIRIPVYKTIHHHSKSHH